MPVQSFRERMQDKQSVFKSEFLGVNQMGVWNGKLQPHILPEDAWSLNLWRDISYDAVQHFAKSEITWHPGKHNMLSSQVMCVNIFFPLREHLSVIHTWLKSQQFDVSEVIDVDFEYIGPHNYFNEKGGRGGERTSADLAITWQNLHQKTNLLLLEFKFTEPNFGICGQEKNPNPQRCFSAEKVIKSPQKQCYRAESGRTYWKHILGTDSPFWKDTLAIEKHCPFRYDFYQLMRNQLLAHCVQTDEKADFERVEFGVISHADNDKLLNMVPPFDKQHNPMKVWPTLLHKPESFGAFTIQGFFEAIDPGLPYELTHWREYIKQRYGV